MIGYYNYTVILTYIGTISGFTGMVCMWNGHLKVALLCLIFAGFCDMFDGKIASTMKRTPQEKRFGIQIDSLSDLICFGALPAMIMYFCGGKSIISMITSALFLLAALIRLAWFNVDEEERQTQEAGSRKVYLGLPVTTSAIGVPLFVGLGNLLKLDFAHHVYPWLLLGIAIAFITPFHMKKPKLVGKIIMMLLGAGCLTVVLLGVPV